MYVCRNRNAGILYYIGTNKRRIRHVFRGVRLSKTARGSSSGSLEPGGGLEDPPRSDPTQNVAVARSVGVLHNHQPRLRP